MKLVFAIVNNDDSHSVSSALTQGGTQQISAALCYSGGGAFRRLHQLQLVSAVERFQAPSDISVHHAGVIQRRFFVNAVLLGKTLRAFFLGTFRHGIFRHP